MLRAMTAEADRNQGHSRRSSYRERLLEHMFIGQIMRHSWLEDGPGVDVLKPQVDDGGYDVVFERGGIVRHVQLKTTFSGSKVQRFNVNTALGLKPSGCVIVILFGPTDLALGPFLWFGADPGSSLPSLTRYAIARHTKGNARGVKLQRPAIRVLPRSAFTRVNTIEAVIARLFGHQQGGEP